MCDFGVSISLVYYTHIPVLVICFLIGIYIYLADRKNPINYNIFIFILFFCLWTVNDFFQWTIKDSAVNLLLARLAIMEVFSVVFFLSAMLALVGKRLSWKGKIVLFLPTAPLFVFLLTKYNAVLVDEHNCYIEFGNLYWYIYLITIGYFIYTVKILWSFYKKNKTNNLVRNQVKIIIGAFGFFIFWFISITIVSWYFVSNGYAIGDRIFIYAPFGMVIFLSMLAYVITRHQFLVVRTIAARIVIFTILILIGTQYLFVSSVLSIILVTLTLALSFIFSLMLLQFVKIEIKQKEELKIANAKLREMDKMKSEFISMASHQLRTPLTTMKGFIGIMKKGVYGEVPARLNEPVAHIETANDRMIALVEDMLNISQIEAGRMKFNFKKESLNDLAEEIFQSFTVMAQEKNLRLELKKTSRLPKVEMDYNKIRETISNIMDNAIKYTPEGSVKIETKRKENMVQIIITDSGIGIAEDGFKFLFDKFARGETAKKIKKSGVGLGLYLGRKIIEAHQGKIIVTSKGAGKGAVFAVELPIVK